MNHNHINGFVGADRSDSFGILGFEFYFPKNYVSQDDLEQFDNVAQGKYINGFGQKQMSFCNENEDVCSLSLTVVSELIHHYHVDTKNIGFLSVGTESLVDKSKSVRTVLMELFPEGGDIEGADVKNACFGGTQALFHAIDWLRANWEHERRLAIVVCADIAVYDKGPARCTGGAGAIAFLLGPNAPLVFETGLRAFYSRNAYDFYKPIYGHSTEYPYVFGSTSVNCYMDALDRCYSSYGRRFEKRFGKKPSLENFRSVLFHSPYARLTQKAFCRLAFADHKNRETINPENPHTLDTIKSFPLENSIDDIKEFYKILMSSCKKIMDEKLNENLEFNQRLGNMYTPSLYAQLFNVFKNISSKPNELDTQRILLFSYGSGCIAAMFSLRFNIPPPNGTHESPGQVATSSMIHLKMSAFRAYQRLDERNRCKPEEFISTLDARERITANGEQYSSMCNKDSHTSNLFPGTYYLSEIDSNKRRFYKRHN